jgi:hypothetical protein
MRGVAGDNSEKAKTDGCNASRDKSLVGGLGCLNPASDKLAKHNGIVKEVVVWHAVGLSQQKLSQMHSTRA